MNMAGLSHESGVDLPNKYLYNGKELQDDFGLGWYDYGARFYDAVIGRWHVVDPMAESYFSYSPYNYVRNNPILRVDKFGKWDVTVHVYNNREQYGYGVAIVTDRNGNEVYRFNVRAEGTGGRDRMQANADTPLGVYDIPDNSPWITGGSRQSYGANARLNMSPESGEIDDSGRDQIRIHGGRQEVYNKKTKKWESVSNPQLKKTHGCLRAYDEDMAVFKQITDNLQANDSEETPGQVTISDDLEQEVSSASEDNMIKVNVTYNVPENEFKFWQNFVNNLLNSNNNNGDQ
jgi:RHS repeat-associated protein